MRLSSLSLRQAQMRIRQAEASLETEIKPVTPVGASNPSRPSWLSADVALPRGPRPDVKVVVVRHSRGKKKCLFQRKENDKRCRCARYVYVAKERLRVPLGTGDHALAAQRAEEYADLRDITRVRQLQRDQEWDAVHSFQRVEVADGFDRFISAKQTAKDSDRNESDDVLSKYRTMKKQFLAFLANYNGMVPEVDRVYSFDQITHELLQDHWRPTWTARSYWSKVKYRDNVISLFHYAQSNRWMIDARKKGMNNQCECIACRMPRVQGKADVQPKLPFNRLPRKHGGDREWQFREILDAALNRFATPERPAQGRRLATFLHVMRYSGARISDVALMARTAIDENGYWRYKALKNKRWCEVQLPPHVIDLLRVLPAAPDSHPDYFFWSGDSERQNAADPWQRDMALLWPLVDARRAEFHQFKDADGIERLGIRDDITGNMVKLGSHLFRNTFTVACRVYSRMGWDRIAQLIGDDQRTVEQHYGPYTEDVKESEVAVEYLCEYRAALIASAVTGKIDVRGEIA